MIHRQKTVFNVLSIVFTAVGFAFLLIAMFVLYKCINDAISYKEKTIGVLKSIGVSSLDIFEIFSIQSVFIIILALISSLLLQYLGVYAVNAVMSKVYGINQFIHSYRVSIFNWLTIIGIAIIIPFIATVSPIIKLSLKNPKDVLNKE
jgi:putative ABC transport system permease protein